MRLFGHIFAVLMSLTLAGGAQACAYLCGEPARVAKAEAPAKRACHGCGEGTSKKSAPVPEKPCEHCRPTGKDKLVTAEPTPVHPPTDLVAFAAPSEVLALRSVVEARGAFRVAVDRPPDDPLHHSCILLI